MIQRPSIGGIVGYGFEAADYTNLREHINELVAGSLEQVAVTAPAQSLTGERLEVIEPSTDQPGKDRIIQSALIELPTAITWHAQQSIWIANCQLISVTSALAKTDSNKLHAMIQKVSKPYTSTIRGKSGKPFEGETMAKVTFHKSQPIFITPRLDYSDKTYKKLRFSSVAKKSPEAHWMPVIEKAYVVLRGNNTYKGLDYENPSAPDIFQTCFDLWGPFDFIQDDSGRADGVGPKINVKLANAKGIGQAPDNDKTFFVNMLQKVDKQPTVATTPSFSGQSDPFVNQFTGMHTYVVVGHENKSIRLWEPLHQRKHEVTYTEFWRVFDMILQRA